MFRKISSSLRLKNMKIRIKYLLIAVILLIPALCAGQTQITGVAFKQVDDAVHITYNTSGKLNNVKVYMSRDGGRTFVLLRNVSGDVGNIASAGAKTAVFAIFKEYGNEEISGNIVFKIEGEDSSSSNIPEPEMVFVEGGAFTMGSPAGVGSDDERPAHQVTVGSFNIGKYEVTQGLWKAVMGSNPSYFKKGDNYPVEQVSWDDVQEFIVKLNALTGKKYRLPTEAEWEYAARGGRQSKGYTYSGGNTAGNVAWYTDNSSSSTHPVGGKAPNELGIYDMSGNVWEWCSDLYETYPSTAQTNPAGPASGSHRVLRGGGWGGHAVDCRSAARNYDAPGYRLSIVGFRLVLP
jgi:formylglycine-generating enzyme required for sulfatase activity